MAVHTVPSQLGILSYKIWHFTRHRLPSFGWSFLSPSQLVRVSISGLSTTRRFPQSSEDTIIPLREHRYKPVSPCVNRDTLLTSSGLFENNYAILAYFKAITVKKWLFLSGALEMQAILPFFIVAFQPFLYREICKVFGSDLHSYEERADNLCSLTQISHQEY